jgi:hypothetical protein
MYGPQKRIAWKLTILLSVLAVTIVIGHGCSKMSSMESSNSSAGTTGGMGDTGGDGAGVGFTPMPGASTVSLLYNKQLVDNMVICAGIGTPSPATTAEWDRRQSSFSEFGYATDVTAPMLLAFAAVAGEICNDLLNIETAVPGTSRRIFNSVDFAAGPGALSNTQVADVTRRIARSCWARDEDQAELTRKKRAPPKAVSPSMTRPRPAS